MPQLRSQLSAESEITEKTQFTMLVPELVENLEAMRSYDGRDTIILAGIETHVCVLATAQDLIERGFIVRKYPCLSFNVSLPDHISF